MTGMPEKVVSWRIARPPEGITGTSATTKGAAQFELVESPLPELAADEVLVEIAGCGICQADFDCLHDESAPVGHEISGTVVAGDQAWLGKEVLVPATLPCGHCTLCKKGQGNLCCLSRIANSPVSSGGFSSHIPVRLTALIPIENRHAIPLEHLAVVTNSAAAALKIVQRAAIVAGDSVIIIGGGELVPFILQFVKLSGAGCITALGWSPGRLQKMLSCGADSIFDATGKTPQDIAGELQKRQDLQGFFTTGGKIIETTGTAVGCETALEIQKKGTKVFSVAACLGGICENANPCRALDAEISDAGECAGPDYSQLLELVLSGRLLVSPFVQTRPMSWIEQVFSEFSVSPPDTHIILTTDDMGNDEVVELKSCR